MIWELLVGFEFMGLHILDFAISGCVLFILGFLYWMSKYNYFFDYHE